MNIFCDKEAGKFRSSPPPNFTPLESPSLYIETPHLMDNHHNIVTFDLYNTLRRAATHPLLERRLEKSGLEKNSLPSLDYQGSEQVFNPKKNNHLRNFFGILLKQTNSYLNAT